MLVFQRTLHCFNWRSIKNPRSAFHNFRRPLGMGLLKVASDTAMFCAYPERPMGRGNFTKNFTEMIQVPKNGGTEPIRLFWGWVFLYISRIHTAYIGEYLHFSYLKCLVTTGYNKAKFWMMQLPCVACVLLKMHDFPKKGWGRVMGMVHGFQLFGFLVDMSPIDIKEECLLLEFPSFNYCRLICI